MDANQLYTIFSKTNEFESNSTHNVQPESIPFWKWKLSMSDNVVSSEILLLKHEFVEIGSVLEERMKRKAGGKSSINTS